MAMAVGAMNRRNRAWVKLFLVLTILLGTSFLGVKAVEYAQKFEHHYTPHTNLFFSFYFIMTGLHALHVLVGVVILTVLLASVARNSVRTDEIVVENVGLYWHFVDVVWIFLFPLLYLT
jgi:heme/copper-type cytochrome/quinol oxidase subunit 3